MTTLPRNQKVFWMSLLGFISLLYILVSINKYLPVLNVPIYPPPEAEITSLCKVSPGGQRLRTPAVSDLPSLPTIYLITPTYPRREQVAELTRLGQTLLLVPNIHWVVAEDSPSCSPLVSDLLERLGLPFTHMTSPQPDMYRAAKLKYKPRGVSSRRAGLGWVLDNTPLVDGGIVYFADDDNTYDVRLFEQISSTKKVSMFPVGLIGEQGVSTPLVSRITGKVVGFSDDWFAQRKFPVDMAGFAVNVEFLRKRTEHAEQAMPYKAGYEEDMFLQALALTLDDIEPLANDCTEVLVWHTKTVKEKVPVLAPSTSLLEKGNLDKLMKFLESTGMGLLSNKGKKIKTCFDLSRCRT